ncbi:unnamed protein product [Lymnaea stagnalis]|uniref:C-type lectin domain-containing protein n=1 Tax=Lymnaea stagnalis TaxID=6523 RepID=A0AAV2I404_LYMST
MSSAHERLTIMWSRCIIPCLILAFLSDVECTCQQDYTQAGIYCYRFPSLTSDWQSADNICKQDGGGLVVISSTDENSTFNNYRGSLPITGDPMWIGVHYVQLNSSWTWQYLTEYNAGNSTGLFHNFANGTIPFGHAGDCVASWPSSGDQWSPINCSFPLNFICETRPLNYPVPTPSNPTTAVSYTNVTEFYNWIKVYNNFRFSLPDSSAMPRASSVVGCAILCTHLPQCLAFNHRPLDNECEFIDTLVNDTYAVQVTGWDIWIDGSLL